MGLTRIINFAAGHPWLVLAILALFTALSATQLSRLHITISAESMLEKGTPAWDYFVDTEETFGAEDVVIIVLRDPDIFDEAKRVEARYALRAIAGLPGVSGTSSVFDAKNLKNIDDTIYVKLYLESLPVTPAEVAAVKAEAIHNPLVLGNLISADGQTLAINVFLKDAPADADFDREITASIEAQIAPLREHIADVYQIGVAAVRSDLTEKIRGDQQVFLPLSVLLLTLAFGLRRVNAGLIPLCTAGLSAVWTLGNRAHLAVLALPAWRT
jgi:predicted RND superfamily exporter protein